MSEKAPARPRQITMAVAMSVVGSLLLVVSLFDTLDRLRTPDMRESIDGFLADMPGSSLDLETAQVVDALRALTFVSGALAAMLLVFAVFVLQRHKGARIGFTVVAALLLLTIPVAGLMPVLLAVAASLVWSRPGRDWYAGRAPAPSAPTAPPVPSPGSSWPSPTKSEQRPPADADQPEPPPEPHGAHPASGSPAHPAPPPYDQQFGQPHPPQQPYAPYQQQQHEQQFQPQSYPPQYQPTSRDPDKRPLTVTVAVALTWLGAGVVCAAMVAFMVLLASGGQLLVDEFNRVAQDSQMTLTRGEILAVGWGMALLFLVWSLISIVLAALALRRNNPARIGLAVSAVTAAFLSLLMILSMVSVVPLLLAGAAAVLLFTGGANEWYSRRNPQFPAGPPGFSGYPGQPPYPGYWQPDPQQGPPQSPPQGPPQSPQQDEPTERPKPW